MLEWKKRAGSDLRRKLRWASYPALSLGGFEFFDADGIAFFDGAQERGGWVETVAEERAEAGVVRAFPWVAGIPRADDAGVSPVGLGDMVGTALAVDGNEMAEGRVVDLHVSPTAEGWDSELGGKRVAKLGVSHCVCCG
jgi:hypothetical protein